MAVIPTIPFIKRKRLTSLLGLSLDGSKLEGVLLRRTNGSLQSEQTFSATLSLDPLTADPELVGQEIRNHLDAAEVRERNCVLGLPLKWALATHVELPEMPEEDLPSFLQIESERGFPCDVQTLLVCSSRCRPSSGKQEITLVGMPRTHLEAMERVLHAAKLKAVSFSLGLSSLQSPEAAGSNGVLALAIGESQVGLQITCGGGVAALRTLEGALESEAGRRVFHPEIVARETRITLGRLPAGLREAVRRIRIFGPSDLSQQLADELELRLEAMGLKIELVRGYAVEDFGLQLPAQAVVSAAFSLAAHRLAGRKDVFEFLPPKISAWQQMTARYSSGRLRFAGAAGCAAVLLVGGLFGWQQLRLDRLHARWNEMAAQVQELEGVKQQIRQYKPWYDDSQRVLSIIQQVAKAFPDDGRLVTAKSIEVRELNVVVCTGTARDLPSLNAVVQKLSKAGMAGAHVVSARGRRPTIQFTLEFRWVEGGRNAA